MRPSKTNYTTMMPDDGGYLAREELVKKFRDFVYGRLSVSDAKDWLKTHYPTEWQQRRKSRRKRK